MLRSDIANSHVAFDTCGNLAIHILALVCMLIEVLFVHRVEDGRACVEEYFVVVAFEGTHHDIRHPPFERIVKSVAFLSVEEVAEIGQNHSLVACVYLTAQAFVEQVETKDGIITSGHGGMEDRCYIPRHREFPYSKLWHLHYANGVASPGCVPAYDIA